jgi:hypothetical protein
MHATGRQKRLLVFAQNRTTELFAAMLTLH